MISKHYTKTATVERVEWTTDVDGNDITTTANSSSILGHLQQASPELIQGLADRFTLSHTFWCDSSSDVQTGDTLIIDGERYGVQDIQNNSFIGSNKHLEIQLEKETDNFGS